MRLAFGILIAVLLVGGLLFALPPSQPHTPLKLDFAPAEPILLPRATPSLAPMPPAATPGFSELPTESQPLVTQEWNQIVLNLASPRTQLPDSSTQPAPIASQLIQTQPAQPQLTTATSPSLVSSLPHRSEPEIFALLYPHYYLDTLKDWQNLSNPPHTFSFTQESDVFAFLPEFVDYVQGTGLITSRDAANLKMGISTTFRDEKNRERAGIEQTSALEQTFLSVRSAVQSVIDFFTPEKTYAGMWVTSPYCYKHEGPAAPSETLHAPTCNSGEKYVPDNSGGHYVPVQDCGENSATCPPGHRFGCLNSACGSKPNAIWDPKSGICGCG